MSEERLSTLEAKQSGTDKSIARIDATLQDMSEVLRKLLGQVASSGKIGWQMIMAAMSLVATIAVIVATLNGAFVLLANGPQWERIYAVEEEMDRHRDLADVLQSRIVELEKEAALHRGIHEGLNGGQ